jgi:hypothetical protein
MKNLPSVHRESICVNKIEVEEKKSMRGASQLTHKKSTNHRPIHLIAQFSQSFPNEISLEISQKSLGRRTFISLSKTNREEIRIKKL